MVELSRLREWITSLARQSEGRLLLCRRQLTSCSPLPLTGCVSYAAFNLHIATSGLPWCGPTLSRALLLHSTIGIGHHLYYSNRLFRIRNEDDNSRKLLQTSYISVLFNLGSVLFIAITKSYLPRSQLLRGIYALMASFTLLSFGLELLEQADRPEQQQPPPQ